MKNLNKILTVAVVLSAFATASQATADEAFLSPRAKANQPHYAPAGSSSVNDPDLVKDHPAGNAKAWEQTHRTRTEPSTVMTPSTAVVSVGYKAVGADGIAASPKLRQQLDDRAMQPIMVAPLK
jgi:hypothetical protein